VCRTGKAWHGSCACCLACRVLLCSRLIVWRAPICLPACMQAPPLPLIVYPFLPPLCFAISALQGQVHGCPYKTFSQESLRAALSRLQVRPHGVSFQGHMARGDGLRWCGWVGLQPGEEPPGSAAAPTPQLAFPPFVPLLQVAPAKIEEAASKAKAGHFQLACAAAWEGKHGCACETGINHPNQVGLGASARAGARGLGVAYLERTSGRKGRSRERHLA